MKETFRNDEVVIYENDNGDQVGIIKDENRVSFKPFYNVVIRRKGEKGKTVKTRCKYETAIQIARDFLQ